MHNTESNNNDENNCCFIGNEVKLNNYSKLIKPVQKGIIIDWEAIETLWSYIFFKELNLSSSLLTEHSVLLTEKVTTVDKNSDNIDYYCEKILNIMFEKFNINSLCVMNQSLLSLFANGLTSGVVLDSGSNLTCSVPIYDGKIISNAKTKIEIGGEDVTNQLCYLMKSQYSLSTPSEINIVREMKEKFCYLCKDYDYELSHQEEDLDNLTKHYELPDGNILTIGNERFKSTELLFQPSTIIGLDLCGIHEMLYNSIEKCDYEIRKELYQRIVLSGGNTMLNQFKERLTVEMSNLVSYQVKILAHEKRSYSPWIGGNIVASSSNFESEWITRKDYEEKGVFYLMRRK